ncbi:MAG: hypothetical protein JW920_11260 [Deltaproteobacteria bacterium]|nr:hypothetical protein [Deltaproteobacteria bacterium]
MIRQKKKLTFFESAAIVTGYGVGGGIMAVPYLASLTGIAAMLIVLILAYSISLLLHLMIAEIMLRDDESAQMVEVFNRYLFRGKGAVIFTWIIFSLLAIAFISSLSAYIAGGGEILMNLLGMPLWVGQCAVYAVAAGVVFFGLKALGISEKYAVIGIILFVVVLAFGSVRLPFHISSGQHVNLNSLLALFGMMMFSFFAIFSVPQVVEGLHWNKKLIPRAIIVGIGLNGVIIIALSLICLGACPQVTRIAIIGLGNTLGNWSSIVGSLFILLAMLSSYWSISFALSVVVQERLHWDERLSWLIATLPSFLIVIAGTTDFLGFMRVAGGAIAVLVAVMVVPLLNAVRKHGKVASPQWSMGFWGGPFFQLLVIAGYILMAVGSMVSI